MKKVILTMVTLIAGFALYGCEENTTEYVYIDYTPAVPQGVYSITGDEAVYLFWLPVRESDLAGYRVYRSVNDDEYFYIGSAASTEYVDRNVINGNTYYYAVTAIDDDGNESELSYETVFDTPRPEGFGLNLADFNLYPGISGYDFSTYTILPFDHLNADIYIEYNQYDEVFYINVTNTLTDIQDMGYTSNFDEIGYSPLDGWSTVGWSELILGHTYIIWTKDNNYAKLRVTAINAPYSVRFDWAYQTDTGNPELARPQHDDGFLKRTLNIGIIK
ncbi:MAG: hypothetical protein AB1690_12660 [Candidatus Zixiibacteriota bacterium]|jgi:hypothetical protein